MSKDKFFTLEAVEASHRCNEYSVGAKLGAHGCLTQISSKKLRAFNPSPQVIILKYIDSRGKYRGHGLTEACHVERLVDQNDKTSNGGFR